MCWLRRSCASVRRALSLSAVALALAGCAVTPDRASTGSIARNSVPAISLLPHISLAMFAAETSGPLSNAEAEVVMARAIAEHEMRRP